jgi:hypothetical protein
VFFKGPDPWICLVHCGPDPGLDLESAMELQLAKNW